MLLYEESCHVFLTLYNPVKVLLLNAATCTAPLCNLLAVVVVVMAIIILLMVVMTTMGIMFFVDCGHL